jgi:hypothetical protein
MFSVPVRPVEDADRRQEERRRDQVERDVLDGALELRRSPPSASSTNEAISITSNQTYRLNRSPVRNAPHTPISRMCSSG